MTSFVTVEALIPEPLAIPAAMVGRALDADVGGANTFEDHTYTDAAGARYRYACVRSVTSEYAAALRQLLVDPAALLATIQLDTNTRFAGADVPTLEECEEFCAKGKVSIAGDTDVLAGLTYVEPEASV